MCLCCSEIQSSCCLIYDNCATACVVIGVLDFLFNLFMVGGACQCC